MLFTYDKTKGQQEGFRKGFGIGNVTFGDIGKNKKLLDQGNNRQYLERLESHYQQDTGISSEDFNKRAEKFAGRLKNVDDEVVKLAQDTYKANGNLNNLSKTFEQQTSLGFKLGSAIKNIGGQLLTSLANGAISFAASSILTGIFSAIQAVYESDKRLLQATQEVTGKFKEQSTELTDYSKKLVELRGVLDDDSSSTEDVKNATSQLYEIQNKVIGQYGAYHQGIDLVNGDLESQLKTLREINRLNAQKAVNDINAQKSNKVKAINLASGVAEAGVTGFGAGIYAKKFFENFIGKNQKFGEAISNTLFEKGMFNKDLGTELIGTSQNQIKDMVEEYDGIIKTSNKRVLQMASHFEKAFKVEDNQIKFKGNIYEINDAITQLQLQLQELGIEDQDVFNQLSQSATDTKGIINQVGDSYNTLIEAEVLTNGQYAKYYRDLAAAYNDYISAQQSGDTEKVEEAAEQYKKVFAEIAESGIGDQYINYFKNLYPELSAIISQWKFEVEIIPKLKQERGLEDFISKNSGNQLKTLYAYYNAAQNAGLPVKAIAGNKWNALENAMSDSGYTNMNDYIDYLKSRPEYSDGMNNIKKLMGKNWKDEFEADFAKLDLTAAVDIKPKKDGLEYTKEEIESELSPVSVEVETKVDADKAVDSMADAKSAITSLEELWQQTVQNAVKVGRDKKFTDANGNVSKVADTSNQAIGYADPAMINNVEAAFSKFSDTFKAEGNDQAANEINNAIKDFEKTLVEFPGEADKAQDAIDTLITSYIDQTDIIKNLTEENAEWSAAQLEAYGIQNAEAVVMSRLNKNAKELATGYAKLKDAVYAYNQAMANDDEEGKSQGIQDITNQLNKMYSFTDQQGVEVNPFDTEYVSQNLEAINQAINDTTGRFNELDRLASKKYITDLIVNADDSQLQGAYSELYNFFNNFDGQSIDIGTSMDATPIYSALATIMSKTEMTFSKFQKMVSQMSGGTITPKIDFEKFDVDIPMPVVDTAMVNNRFAEHKAGKVDYMKTKIHYDLPKFSYEYTGKPTKAQYGGAPKTGGSGGGGGNNGGGGDNSSADKANQEKGAKSTAETYDWIAVAIQRLEEEIERLDKQVGNVFKTWENRNEKLKDEIAEVTKEIKAQQLATQEYARNTTLVSSSGQALTDKDTSDIEKAKKEWKKGTWQDIAKKGKLKQKDVDKIKNEYLQQSVQELYDQQERNKQTKKENKEIRKKNEKITDPKKKKKEKKLDKTKYRIGDLNMPKRSDFDNNKQYKQAMKDYKAAEKIWNTIAKDENGKDVVDQFGNKLNKYKQLVQQGLMTGNDIEQIRNEYLREAINLYKEEWQKVIDAQDAVEELKIKNSELNRQKLDNLLSQWDELISMTEHEINLLEKYASRAENMGYWIDEKSIKQRKKNVKDELDQVTDELMAYKNQFNEWMTLGVDNGGLEKGSEAWYKAIEDAQNLIDKREELIDQIKELEKAQRELKWEQFDYLEEKLSDIIDEAEFLSELASVEKTMDEYGRFNDRGMTNLAMLGIQYDEYIMKLKRYQEEQKKLEADLVADPDNKDIKNRLDDITKETREAAKNIASSMQSIFDKVQESIDAHLSKVKELMDDYKTALSTAKDLYSFSKNIGDQTKNIENLRKQLVAYQGDDSEAGRKRRQELTNQLNAAEQQLQETEWDRYISQTGEMLDNLYEDYEDILNARMDDVNGLVQEVVREINLGRGDVKSGLEKIQKEFGVNTTNFKPFLEDTTESLLSGFNDGELTNKTADIVTNTTDMKKAIENMEKAMEHDYVRKALFGESKTLEIDEKGFLKVTNVYTPPGSGGGGGSSEDDGEAKRAALRKQDEDALATAQSQLETRLAEHDSIYKKLDSLLKNKQDLEKQYEKESGKKKPDKKKLKSIESDIYSNEQSIQTAQINLSNWEDTINQLQILIENITSRLNANAYATGSKHISKKQLAWTQEDGTELIFRSSDGAMLTPLSQGDMVFTNEMSQRLWEIASGNIPNTLGSITMPNVSSNVNSTINNSNEIIINLPNVNDYDSFKRELQNDTKFEKFIQEITIGQVSGNNTLNKRKY